MTDARKLTEASDFDVISVPPGPEGVSLVVGEFAARRISHLPCALIPAVGRHFSETAVKKIIDALKIGTPLMDSTLAVLTTSGSTGNPRGVEFSLDHLTAFDDFINSGAVIRTSFTSPPQWISALPVTSIGGFNVIVRASHSGIAPIALSSVGGAAPFSAREVTEAMTNAGSHPIAISLVPVQFRKLLNSDEGLEALRGCSLILVGGSATPTEDHLRAQDAGLHVTYTYGMTETTGGAVFSGVPAPGVEVTCDVAEGNVVTISGVSVANGYRGEPPFAGSFRTSDTGSIDSQGKLTVLGRIDDVIMVNGVNVSLGAIESVVRHVPGVTDCFVLPGLLALIECDPSLLNHITPEIRQAVSEKLGGVAVPTITWVEHIPQLPNGKPDRQKIFTLYG